MAKKNGNGFVNNMLSKNGKISSKRVCTFVCLFFMMVGYIANLFWGFEVQEHLFNSLQWIVMAGLGFTASENFAPGGPTPEPTPEPATTDEEAPSDADNC